MTARAAEPRIGDPADRLLPWPRVRDLTGISRTTAWRLQKAGDFPLPVVISPGRVGWRESELEAWKASRAPRRASSRATSPPARPDPQRSFLHLAEAPEPLPPARSEPEPRKPKPAPRRRATRDSAQLGFDF